MPNSSLNEPRELADRHAVPHRHRIQADERLESVHEHRPFDRVAADRVRADRRRSTFDAVLAARPRRQFAIV